MRKQRKARNTLINVAVPKTSQAFPWHDDAKEIWASYQDEGLVLDALGAGVSDEDANHKFLRSLPPAWDSLAMTMRTKKNIDTLSIDDLYNNLSVFEQDIQKTSSSSLASDNVAFLSQAKASSSKHKPSQSSGSYSSYTTSTSQSKNQSATPVLLMNQEGQSGWKNACGIDKRKVEMFQLHNTGHFARELQVKGSKERSIGKGRLHSRNSIIALMAFTVNNENPLVFLRSSLEAMENIGILIVGVLAHADSMNYIPVSVQNQANPAGSKEVIDIDVQTEEDADLMVVSSTSLSKKIATKKTHSSKQSSSTPISKSAEDIMTFRQELDALALKHLGPVPTTAPTSTNPVNTGSINLNTAFEEVNTGNTEASSPRLI
ncbi:hypothetical protein Tco_1516224 [Tanacetum coccineum]